MKWLICTMAVLMLGFLSPAAHGKDTVLVFGAKWCPACQRLSQTTLRDPVVVAALAQYDYKYVDVDEGDGPVLAKVYRVRVLPTYVRLGVREKRGTGYRDPAQFVVWLER